MLVSENHLRKLINKSLLENAGEEEIEKETEAIKLQHDSLTDADARMLAQARLASTKAQGEEQQEENEAEALGDPPKEMGAPWTDADGDSFRDWLNDTYPSIARRTQVSRPAELKAKYSEDTDVWKQRSKNRYITAAYNRRGTKGGTYGQEWYNQVLGEHEAKKAELEAAAAEKELIEKGLGPIDTEQQFWLMRQGQSNSMRALPGNVGQTLEATSPMKDLTQFYRRGLSIVYCYHVNEFDGSGGANTDEHRPWAAHLVKKQWQGKSARIARPGLVGGAENGVQYEPVDNVLALAYDPATQDLFVRYMRTGGEPFEKVIKGVPYEQGFLMLAKGVQEGENIQTLTSDEQQEADVESDIEKAKQISSDIESWWPQSAGFFKPFKSDNLFTGGDDEASAFREYKNKVWPRAAIKELNKDLQDEFDDLLDDIEDAMNDEPTPDVTWTIGDQGYQIEDDYLDF